MARGKVKRDPKGPKMPEGSVKGKYEYMFEVAYEFEDARFGKFNVRKSANAWWMNPQKLENLLNAKRYDMNDLESCYHAGITPKQLEYFKKEHPHFCDLFEALPMAPRTIAKMTIVHSLDKVPDAQWYAAHKMKDEFSQRKEMAGPNGEPLFANPYRGMTEEQLDAELAKGDNDPR